MNISTSNTPTSTLSSFTFSSRPMRPTHITFSSSSSSISSSLSQTKVIANKDIYESQPELMEELTGEAKIQKLVSECFGALEADEGRRLEVLVELNDAEYLHNRK